jgi:phospholipid transport system substrate-binding protein
MIMTVSRAMKSPPILLGSVKLRLIKTLVVVFSSIICYAQIAFAADTNDEGVRDFIKDISKKVIFIAENNQLPTDKESALALLFDNVMDVNWIGKFVLGKYWNTLNNKEKEEYLELYNKYLISSYVPLFKKYNGQHLIIKDVKSMDNEQYIVVTEIRSYVDNQSYNVEYRLKFINTGFKVRDIIAEGVSLLTTQRSEFGAVMGETGIKGLMEKLKEKIS